MKGVSAIIWQFWVVAEDRQLMGSSHRSPSGGHGGKAGCAGSSNLTEGKEKHKVLLLHF